MQNEISPEGLAIALVLLLWLARGVKRLLDARERMRRFREYGHGIRTLERSGSQQEFYRRAR